jgi:hypothetical protein
VARKKKIEPRRGEEEERQVEALKEQIKTAKAQIDQVLASMGVPPDKVVVLSQETTSEPDDEEDEADEAEVAAACQRRDALLGLFMRETAGLSQKFIDFSDELSKRTQDLCELAVGTPPTVYGYGRLNQALLAVAVAVAGVTAALDSVDRCIAVDQADGFEPEIPPGSTEAVRYVETKTHIVSCDECPKRATCPKARKVNHPGSSTLN